MMWAVFLAGLELRCGIEVLHGREGMVGNNKDTIVRN